MITVDINLCENKVFCRGCITDLTKFYILSEMAMVTKQIGLWVMFL